MKKILSIAVALFSTLSLLASVNTLNYQAVINTPDGTPASDKEIGMRFAVVNGDNILIAEETVVKSSADGLVEWQIGSTLSGGLSAVDWSIDGLMLQVGIDLNGGKDYTSVYSSTIQSVPAAMYAERSGDSDELRHMIDTVRAEALNNLLSIDNIVRELYERCDNNTAVSEKIVDDVNNLAVYVTDLRAKTEMLIYELDKSREQIAVLEASTEAKFLVERAYTDDRINEVCHALNVAIAELQGQIDSLKK